MTQGWPASIAEQNARRRQIAEAAGLPPPREISMCLYAAGMARARVAPEVDLSPLPWLTDDWWLRAAYIEPSCMEHLDKALAARAARILTRENDFELFNLGGESGLILPPGRA
jgi:hypothetical protein